MENKTYTYHDIKDCEEGVYVGHISAAKRKYGDPSLVDQKLEEADKLCEVGFLSIWRDLGDEIRSSDNSGSLYGYNIWLITKKRDSKKKVDNTVKKLREFFKDWG